MAGRFVDKSDEYNRQFQASVTDGAVKSAGKLRTFARRKVNRKYYKKASKKKGGHITGDTGASVVGEPPKRRSGRGREAIDKTRNIGTKTKPAARTYVSKKKAEYMVMYEDGPPSIRRPFLGPATKENEAELFTIMTDPPARVTR